MAINRSVGQRQVNVADAQLARVAAEGSARHKYLNALLEASGRHSGRDLSDAVHLLCSLHGRYPGLIEVALQRCPPWGRCRARREPPKPRRAWSLPATPWKLWRCRSATAARSAPLPPWSATGG